VVIGDLQHFAVFQGLNNFLGGLLRQEAFIITYKIAFLGKLVGFVFAIVIDIITDQAFFNKAGVLTDLPFGQEKFTLLVKLRFKQRGDDPLFFPA
jgi:hypothetical protein